MERVKLVLVCWLLAVSVARAGTPEKDANALYEEAKALMSQGDHALAVEKLTTAWATYEHVLILKKRAEAYEKLLDYERALEDYKVCLERTPVRAKADRKLLSDRIAALEGLLLKPVQVKVVSTPPGAPVAIDGRAPQRAPFTVGLPPGEHVAVVKDPRFEAFERRFRVTTVPGQAVSVELVARRGRVVIRTSHPTLDGVTISVDAEPLELAPEERLGRETRPRELTVGRHNVVCATVGSPNAYVEFDVAEGQVVEVHCQLVVARPSALGDGWGWTTASLGLAGVAAGTGLLVSYALDVETAEERNQDLITNKHYLGGAFLGVGVGLAVGSYWVFTRHDDTVAFELTPTLDVGDSQAILGATGRF